MGQAYVNFMRNCIDQIRSKVLDELWILTFFEVSVDLNCVSDEKIKGLELEVLRSHA